MYDSPEERKDGDEKVSEEQPLMKDAKEKLKYTDENDDNNPRVYPFHYNTSSELERFSIFREVLEVVFMIILVIVLLPLLLVAFICFVVSSLCWRKVGTTFAFRRTKFNEHVMQRVLSSVGHYVPPWYYNNHLGTCIPFGATPGLTFEREVYYQSDGSRFAVDWYPECPTSPLSPSSPPSSSSSSSSTPRTIILYLCGLGLSSDANVAQQFAKQISILRRSECTTTGIIVPRGHPTSRLKWTTARAWYIYTHTYMYTHALIYLHLHTYT